MIANLGYRRYKTTIGELELFVGVRKRGFRRIVRLKGTSEYILKFRSKAIFAMIITTVFVDTRLWKTRHPRKRFKNVRQSCVGEA